MQKRRANGYKEIGATERISRWKKENKDKVLLQKKRYYDKHARSERERIDKWRLNNKEKVRLQRARRKNAERGTMSNLSLSQWQDALAFFENRCAYCNEPLTKVHKDHFVPVALGGGFTKNNIVPACPRCNLDKRANHPEQWLASKPDVFIKIQNYLSSKFF